MEEKYIGKQETDTVGRKIKQREEREKREEKESKWRKKKRSTKKINKNGAGGGEKEFG